MLGAGFYIWNTTQVIESKPACSEPISYTIGTFDRRFGISYTTFLEAVSDAESMWEKSIDKELFHYSPEKGGLNINLIYDYRQEVTETLSDISEVVGENEATYNSLLRQFKSLKLRYDADEASYDSLVDAFNTKNSQYDKMVEDWNDSSRTSKSQFKKLEDLRFELQADLSDIKSLENNLNAQAREINSLVDRLNTLARTLNLNVEKFNAVGASRGEMFTGGLYINEGQTQRIDIYEFSNRDKLVRVLVHELGHALGLEHVADPKAIMYYLNKGETGILTSTDIAELKKLCGMGN